MSELLNGWKRTKDDNPEFTCRKCGSNDIQYRSVESSDGAYDDIKYKCFGCGRTWWFESSDY